MRGGEYLYRNTSRKRMVCPFGFVTEEGLSVSFVFKPGTLNIL